VAACSALGSTAILIWTRRQAKAAAILVAMNRRSQTPLVVAVASAMVVAISIVIGTILNDIPDALWVLLVPVGLLGGALVCLVSLAVFFTRRARRA
jgi:hypothetical protein